MSDTASNKKRLVKKIAKENASANKQAATDAVAGTAQAEQSEATNPEANLAIEVASGT